MKRKMTLNHFGMLLRRVALADEIWGLVEKDQVKAFISDGLMAVTSKRQLFSVVRASLKYSRRVVKNTRAFLQKYNQL